MQEKKGLFGYLPVSFFGSVMGLSGLSIAWRIASSFYNVPIIISQIIAVTAILAFAALFICYGLKIITSYEDFRAEYSGPLTRSFFGTFTISVLLLPIIIFPYAPTAAKVMWVIGTFLMFLFALHIVSFWIGARQDQLHVTPAWIIPVVGTLDIPLAFKLFDISWASEASLAAVAIGLFFAIPVFTIIISRIIFFEPMPAKLTPSLMILIAPFAVGFSAYVEVSGHIDMFAKMLYFIGLFIFITLIPELVKSRICCPFKVTWWAVSFPLSAILVATLKMTINLGEPFFNFLSFFFLIIVSAAILWLTIRTLKGILNGDLKSLS